METAEGEGRGGGVVGGDTEVEKHVVEIVTFDHVFSILQRL